MIMDLGAGAVECTISADRPTSCYVYGQVIGTWASGLAAKGQV